MIESILNAIPKKILINIIIAIVGIGTGGSGISLYFTNNIKHLQKDIVILKNKILISRTQYCNLVKFQNLHIANNTNLFYATQRSFQIIDNERLLLERQQIQDYTRNIKDNYKIILESCN